MPLTLAAAVATHLATTVLFVLLATTLSGRRTTGSAELANTMFVTFWLSVALQSLLSAIRIVLIQLDAPLSLVVGLQFATLAALTMGLAGLLYYLLYLYTGRSVMLWPLLLFYALYCGFAIDLLADWRPNGYRVDRWSASLAYADPGGAAETLLALAGLAGPQLLAVLGLVVLAIRLPSSAARIRVGVLAIGILVWFGNAFLGQLVDTSGDAWRVFALVLPVLVGAGILIVYRPPVWLRERLPPEIPVAPESEASIA